MRVRALLLVPLLVTSCPRSASFEDPLPDDGTFAAGTPTEAERDRCTKAVAYSRSKNGYAVLMLRDDQVVCEDYHGDTAQPDPHHLFSGTKSFSCLLAAALAEEGTLRLDDRVADTVTQWKSDTRKSRITVRQLLHFVSGLRSDEARLTLDGLAARQLVKDKYAVALDLPAEHDPGAHYEYGSMHLMAFGGYVKQLTGRDPLALLEEKVFTPLGFRYSGWMKDPTGNAALPYGAFTTTREWAKIGSLLLHQGEWRGQRVLSAARLAECLEGTEVMPGYGLTFWLNVPVPADRLAAADTPVAATDGEGGRLFYTDGPEDLYAAAGAQNQRLYLVPSRNLLVLRQGGSDGSWSDAAFLARALDGVER